MRLDKTIQQHLENLPLSIQSEVLDYVLYMEQKTGKQSSTDSERRKCLASALEKAAALNPYAEVDPITWVREQRDSALCTIGQSHCLFEHDGRFTT